MAGTQSYIGIRNGVVVCVEEYSGYDMRGCFYHGFSRDAVSFEDCAELLKKLENLFDVLNFPHPATNERYFDEETVAARRARRFQRPFDPKTHRVEEREKIMSDHEMLNKHGDAGTFIVRVQQRQNSSWQGRITWVDEDKTVYFRSVFEMMKLIDAALQSTEGSEEHQEATWE